MSRAATVEALGPRRSDAHTAALLAAHFAFVFGPVWLAAWAGPGWLTIACWLWVGLFAHGFHLVMHELIHKLLFRDVHWNEWVAFRLIAPFFLVDFDAFRRRHWAHHRRLGTADDPKYTYRIDPAGTQFLTLALSMLTVIGAARKFSLQVGEQSDGSAGSKRRALAAAAVVQPVFLASIVAAARAGHPHDWLATLWAAAIAYGVVFLYGLASLTVWMTTLRGIAEHRRAGAGDIVDGDAALRNFSPGLLEWLLFGAYGFVDHATHHRHPAVPWYQLSALSRALACDDATLRPVGTHLHVLARLARRQNVPVGIGDQSMGTSTRAPSASEATR